MSSPDNPAYPHKLKYDDRLHAYWLDGRRCRSVSTVAKIPDDTFALDQWRKRQVLVGVALRPTLVERAAAHFDDRDIMNRLAEEAMEAAKSHEAAGRGTAAHRIAERADLGEMIIDSPQARAVQKAWQHALDVAGLEIVPELVERIVVYPQQRIAGRFDRFARRKADGRLVVLDIKTGSSAVKYPHAVAVQLALYANAPLMAGPVGRDGGTTEQFEPLPEVDKTIGYVVHMPDDEHVDVVGVDLAAGWDAANLCFMTLDWRARKDLLIPVTEIPVETPCEAPRPVDRTPWILGRLKTLATLGRDARAATAKVWPVTVPPHPPWTDDQIDLLDKALEQVETQTEAPFPPINPTNPKGIR